MAPNRNAKIFIDGLKKHLISHGYHQHQTDSNVYTKTTEIGFVTLLVTIDDLLVISNNQALIKQTKQMLKSKHDTTELGPVEHILQWKITRKHNQLTINQPAYIDKILHEYGMDQSKPTKTPYDYGSTLTKQQQPGEQPLTAEHTKQYKSIVGSLRYLANCTRPDIGYITGQLGRYVSAPTHRHLKAVKRVLRYLQGTRTHGITYGPKSHQLHTYSDSDHASDQDTRLSTTGNLHFLNGGPRSWRSTKQNAVVLSTTEAEYIAASTAARHIQRLRAMIAELHRHQKAPTIPSTNNPTQLFIDNQSALKIAQTIGKTRKSKYIDVRHHYIRDMKEKGVIEPKYTPTEEMKADFLTKQLTRRNSQRPSTTAKSQLSVHRVWKNCPLHVHSTVVV